MKKNGTSLYKAIVGCAKFIGNSYARAGQNPIIQRDKALFVNQSLLVIV